MNDPADTTVDFGYEDVDASEKTARVKAVFDSVAGRYDLMNDLMSFGLHRIWKRVATMAARVQAGDRILDLAGGTGDLTKLLAARIGDAGHVVLADINGAMLEVGRDRVLDGGIGNRVSVAQASAENLPFADKTFKLVTIAFGLRNVTRKQIALEEMYRVLEPGGRALILEFSELKLRALRPLYDAFSLRVLPRLGAVIAKDAGSYRYLAESIRRHPNQDALLEMMVQSGFERCRYTNMSGGIVALHDGIRL